MQYAKLMLDGLDAVTFPVSRSSHPALPTSLFQAVNVTALWPLALDHFQKIAPTSEAEWPVVAHTSLKAIPPGAPPFQHAWFEWNDKGAITGMAVVTYDLRHPEKWVGGEFADALTATDWEKGARWTQVLVPYFNVKGDHRPGEV